MTEILAPPSAEGKLSARQRRALEHSAIHGNVIAESSKAAVVGGVIALGASFAAQRFSPLYRKISFPFKTFIVMSAITGTFFTVADREAMIADRKFAQFYSITKDNTELVALPPTRLTDYLQVEALKGWTLDHRYQVVGYSWLAMAVGTMLYQWKRKDIKTAQKLINARMASQLLALLGFAAVAGAAATVPEKKIVDPHFEEIINGPNVDVTKH